MPTGKTDHGRGIAGRRRGALAVAAVLAALFFPFACSLSPEDAGPAKREKARNLLLIVIDTLRWDHLGAYGYERDTTPTIDALAAEGTLFTRTYAQAPWTVPSTATLLTSLYPRRHGAYIPGEVKHLGQTPPGRLSPEARTLGPILGERGFRTGLFSANPFLYGRFKEGFDEAVVERQDAASLTGKVVEWLGQENEKPFFIHLQYMDLHHPNEPPAPYFDFFPVTEGGERGPEHAGWRFGRLENRDDPDFKRFSAHRLALYDGSLRYVDSEIARLLETLRDGALLDDTLIVITSDHGEEFWDHAEMEIALGGDPRNLYGIGHGHSMFEELIRVPLIFKGPGAASGEKSGCVARLLDVAPTLLELTGAAPLPAMKGVSLARLLRSPGEKENCRPVPVLADSPAYGPDAQAVIWKGKKLVRRGDGAELLFDLEEDPREERNLADREPALVSALATIMADELETDTEKAEIEPMEFDEETERQLRSLGYLK